MSLRDTSLAPELAPEVDTTVNGANALDQNHLNGSETDIDASRLGEANVDAEFDVQPESALTQDPHPAEAVLLSLKAQNKLPIENIYQLATPIADTYVASSDIAGLARIAQAGIFNASEYANTALEAGQVEKVRALLQDPSILGAAHDVYANIVAELDRANPPEPKEAPVPLPKPEPKAVPEPVQDPTQDPDVLLRQLGEAYKAQIRNTLTSTDMSLDEKVQKIRADRDQAIARAGLDRGELDRLIANTLRETYRSQSPDSLSSAKDTIQEIKSITEQLGLSSAIRGDLQGAVVDQVRSNTESLFAENRQAILDYVNNGRFDDMDDIQGKLQSEIRKFANSGNPELDRMIKVELGKAAVEAMLTGQPYMGSERQYSMGVRADQAEDLASNLGIERDIAGTVSAVAAHLYQNVPNEVKAQGTEAELAWIKQAERDLDKLRQEFDLESHDQRGADPRVRDAISALGALDNELQGDRQQTETRLQEERTAAAEQRQQQARERLVSTIDSVIADPDMIFARKGQNLAELRGALIDQGGMTRQEADQMLMEKLEPYVSSIELNSLERTETMLWATNNMIRALDLSQVDADKLRTPFMVAAREQLAELPVRTVEERQRNLEMVERMASRGGLSRAQEQELKGIIEEKGGAAVDSALASYKARLDRIMNSGQSLSKEKSQARSVINEAVKDIRDPQMKELYRKELGLHALKGMLGDPSSVRTVSQMENLMDYAEDLWYHLPIREEAAELIANFAEEMVGSQGLGNIPQNRLMFLKNAMYEIQQENDLQSHDRSRSNPELNAAIGRLESLRGRIDSELAARRRRGSSGLNLG